MRIEAVLFAPCHGAFFNDDQAAIRGGAGRDGFLYEGAPITDGFDAIRIPAVALGIGLVLGDGSVFWGDMMTVQYAGAGGREPPLDIASLQTQLESELVPGMVGLELDGFGAALHRLSADGYLELPNSAKYGISQALLAAVAHARRCSMAEVVCAEFDFPMIAEGVPIYCQSGEDRYGNVDKMILRRADVLPHGLINSPTLIGTSGERFFDYVLWVRDRVAEPLEEGYQPTLHFDVYGGLGHAFGNDVEAIADYLCRLEAAVAPLTLQIEAVADFGSRRAQIEGFCALRESLSSRGSAVRLVADEWCNTLEDVEVFVAARAVDLIQMKMPDMGSLDDTIRAIRACRAGGVGTYLGGSCTETDVSARVSVHIGIAAQVDMMLAKPGMGVDEGHAIVANEQSRLLALLNSRSQTGRRDQSSQAPSVLGQAW